MTLSLKSERPPTSSAPESKVYENKKSQRGRQGSKVGTPCLRLKSQNRVKLKVETENMTNKWKSHKKD